MAHPRISQKTLKIALLPLLAGGALQAACSSSPTDKHDHSHGGETSMGGGGTGGKSATGGASTGGASSGGSATGGSGLGGGGGAVEPAAAIAVAHSRVLTGINDLRGLTFSASGKIYGSGFTDAEVGNRKIVLVRLNSDGTFDTSFDEDGIVTFDAAPAGQSEDSMGVVELPDGSLLLQANISDGKGGELIDDANVDDSGLADPTSDDGVRPNGVNVALIKFSSTGQVVSSFGSSGVKIIDFGWTDGDDAAWPKPVYNSTTKAFTGAGFPSDQAWGLVLDPSSAEGEPMVVLSGHGPAAKVASGTQRTDNDRYIVRVSANDGSIDPAFNGGKVFTLNTLGTIGDGGRRHLVEADGSIVSSGYSNFGATSNNIVLIRLKKDGTPDSKFDFGLPLQGVAVANPFADDGGAAEAYAVGKQSNGRYVTTGYGSATSTMKSSSYGYTTTVLADCLSFGIIPGSLDSTFGLSGTLAIQSEDYALADTDDRGRDLVVLKDDRIIHAGRFGGSPALFVTTANGFLDASVGDEGRLTFPAFTAPTSQFFRIAMSEDGKHVAASTNNHAEGVRIAVLTIGD